MADSGSYDTRFAAIRRAFESRARSQASRLGELRRRLETAAPSSEDVAELKSLCHSLHGGAGTFGYLGVGEVAAEVESICDTLSGLSECNPAKIQMLASTVDQLLGLMTEFGTVDKSLYRR